MKVIRLKLRKKYSIILPWLQGGWPSGATSCLDAVAVATAGSAAATASALTNQQSILDTTNGYGQVEVIVEVSEIPPS